MNSPIRPRDRDAVIQSLRAGVVPRSGQHLIQVGRAREIETLVADIARIADGGSAFRVVIGEYGAGKTFFLNLVRAVALEKKLVVATADLNPDRRLQTVRSDQFRPSKRSSIAGWHHAHRQSRSARPLHTSAPRGIRHW